MGPFLILGFGTMLLAGSVNAAEQSHQGWKTYRSVKFGYELSYPADMEYKAYFEGSSADLKDARTGHTLVSFEVWPPHECPRQPENTIAKEVGIERAKTMTQADGPDGSSYCGDPLTVREYISVHGAKVYELELTCMRESHPQSHDDTDDAGPQATTDEDQPIVTVEGKKGPTYFVDISPSWKKRILSADPVGIDPRIGPTKQEIDPVVVRKILETLKTFPTQKPLGICIEELKRGLSIGIPTR